jgi:DNA repair exonuclease SbcCD ATPase subunit
MEKAKVALSSATGDLWQSIRTPHALSTVFEKEMIDLKAHLDRLKLPESATRQFFQELAEADACVCGRPIDDGIRQEILRRSEEYLGDDDNAFLNSMKLLIANKVEKDPGSHNQDAAKLSEFVIQLEMEMLAAKGEVEFIENEASSKNPAIMVAQKLVANLTAEKKVLTQEMEKYSHKVRSGKWADSWNLEELRKKLDHAEDQLAEITHTLGLKEKRDSLVSIFESAKSMATDRLGQAITLEANDRIKKLMPDNDVQIEAIGTYLKLKGKSGGSEGESLSLAYAFLATLFDRANHRLPFVVDSPANPIDDEVRRKVAQLVPRLSHQFIAFTITSERPHFVNNITRDVPDSVQHITLFRKGNLELEESTKIAFDVVESNDGFVVKGESFFNQFHQEKEENNGISS